MYDSDPSGASRAPSYPPAGGGVDDIRLLPQDGKIDLLDLFMRFLRRLPIFLVVAALILAAAVAYTVTRAPTYTATASVVIQPRRTDVIKEETPVVSDLPTDSAALDTEALVLNSEDLMLRVVRRLNLQNDPEFNPPPEPGRPPPVIPASQTPEQWATLRAARRVQGNTQVRRNGTTYVIDVTFESIDPQKSARIANAIVEEYIASLVDSNVATTEEASVQLQSRLQQLQRELQANEAALQQYTVDNNLMSAAGATMAEQEVSTLNQQIASAAADLAERRARLQAAREQIARGSGGADVAAVQESVTVRDLRRSQAQLKVELAQMETRYGPLHPDVRKAKEQLAVIDAQIETEIGRVISSLEADVRASQQRYDSLLGSRNQATAAMGSNNRSRVTQYELQRKVDASRAVYEAFLNRSKETTAQQGLHRPEVTIAARARTPSKPSSPNKPINYGLGLVFALIGGAGAVLLVETLDGTMRTSADVRSRLKVASLGSVPLMKRTSQRAIARMVIDKPFSSFAESFRSLKRSIWAATRDKPRKVIALTSAVPAEGKTLTTLCFGRSLAMGGARVLLIDADLRRRMLTAAFGVKPEYGLVEVLTGEVQVQRAIIKDDLSGAYLMPLSTAAPPEADIFDGPTFPALLQYLKDQMKFDAVVIDTAPVLAIADTRAIVEVADVTVLAVRWGKTPKHAARAALDLLQNAGAKVAGVCLTMVDLAKQAQLTYGDATSYHGAFKKYYTE
jgi:capsular exopolysaccharide synthesis family protein